MGCVSSSYIEDEAANLNSGLGHHIVSLTSTTYGLLSSLDSPYPQHTNPHPPQSRSPSPPPPPPPPPPLLTASPSPNSCISRRRSEPEVINAWELMEGLDPLTPPKSFKPMPPNHGKENAHRVHHFSSLVKDTNVLQPSNSAFLQRGLSLETFEKRCPPGGEQAVVLYTTTLRGIRKTFEDCNAVRAVLEGSGVLVRERDVSMDLGFLEELRALMVGPVSVPRVFVRGRYIGGAEQVLRMHEEGGLGFLFEGLPKARHSGACDGCGGGRFLPCFTCSGSRKLVLTEAARESKGGGGVRLQVKAVRCPDCNENGLVLCPICS